MNTFAEEALSRETWNVSRMQKYRHTTLSYNDIRLLRIHPGEFNDEIHCDMLIINLDSRPRYKAISYTWGEEMPLHEIIINGASFSTRSNCLYALRQARAVSGDDMIWIDAICINQEDLEERGHQVSFMGKLYQQATQVLACIGRIDLDEASGMYIDTLVRHSDNFEILWQGSEGTNTCERCKDSKFHEFEKRTCHVVHLWLATITANDLYDLYDAVETISKSSYWTRLWVVQEIMVQKDVRILCGLRSIWFQFLLALAMVKQHINGNDPVLRAVAQECDLIDLNRPQILRLKLGQKLFEMCVYRYLGVTDDVSRMNIAALNCADLRDRVYGLLHVQSWPESTGPPTPSYFKSRLEVLMDYFRHRGLGPSWFQELCDLLDVFGIPDEKSWDEMTSLLYKYHTDTSRPIPQADSASEKCACEIPAMPGRFIISRGCRHLQGFYVVKDDNDELRTCLSNCQGDEHICPVIRAYSDLRTFQEDTKRTQTCTILSILGQCEEGDILFPLDLHGYFGERGAVPPRGLGHNIVIVLREMPNRYYAAVGFSVSQAISICEFGAACSRFSPEAAPLYDVQTPRRILVYTSIEDVVIMILHRCALEKMGHNLQSGQANACSWGFGWWSGLDFDPDPINDRPLFDYSIDNMRGFRFPHSNFSTVGVLDNLATIGEHSKLLGLPSLDGTATLCAFCGGLSDLASFGDIPELSDLPGVGIFPAEAYSGIKRHQALGHMLYRG